MGLTRPQREVLRTPNSLPKRRSYLSSIPSLSLARRSIGVVGRSVGITGRSVGPADSAADSVVDNFNDDDDADKPGIYNDVSLSDVYTLGDLGPYTRIESEDALTGTTVLEFADDNSQTIGSPAGSGLNRYIQKGDIFRIFVQGDSEDPDPGFAFGMGSSLDDRYQIEMEQGNNNLRVAKSTDGAFTELEVESFSPSDNTWYELVVEWHDGSGTEPDNEIVAQIWKVDQNTGERTEGSEEAEVTTNDDDHEDHEGVGIVAGSGGKALYDDYRWLRAV